MKASVNGGEDPSEIVCKIPSNCISLEQPRAQPHILKIGAQQSNPFLYSKVILPNITMEFSVEAIVCEFSYALVYALQQLPLLSPEFG